MATNPEQTIYERLLEPFNADCVEWRAQTMNKQGTAALALAYIDARSVMARLDEVLGPQNWQDSYREEGGRMVCRLELRIDDQWRFKEDGSGDTNFEAEKGGISGAFKRAAVKWGIGRYLYDVDSLWADCTSYEKNGKRVFKGWTDKGEHDLATALNRAPGPRVTGKPLSVERTIELMNVAETLAELRRLFEQNWATIPLDYRREVLTAKEHRKQELETTEKEQRDERA